MFPTTIVVAPKIDAVEGSTYTKNYTYTSDGKTVGDKDTFGTCIRNTDPCTNAGLPSLSIPAGMTTGGLPVGMEIDGKLGDDSNLLAIGMAIEAVWGSLPAPTI